MDLMVILSRIVALSIVLGIIVLVHELGHFLAAKLMKVKVEAFSFGFGKRLFGKKIGDTDVRVSLIPLGGYVKMAGEENFEAKDPQPYEFQAKNRAQKIFILFMGPAMNFVLAFFIMVVINVTGVDVAKYKSYDPVIGHVLKDSPAYNAGIRKGDLILSVNGEKIENWQELEFVLGSSPNEDLEVVYRRDGEIGRTSFKVDVMSRENRNPAGIGYGFPARIGAVEEGKPADLGNMKPGDVVQSINGKDVTFFEFMDVISNNPDRALQFVVKRGEELFNLDITPRKYDDRVIIGVRLGPDFETELARFGLFASFARSGEEMVRMTRLTVDALRKLITGRISAKHVSGPIDIAKISQEAMESSAPSFFFLIAFLSLHIGLINLLPIPVLDGGHLLIYSIESIIRRDFNPRVKIALMNFGLLILICLMVFVILNDIVKNLPNGWKSLLPF